MNTRTYPRTLNQAFPQTPQYAASIERPPLSLWQRILFALRG